MKKKTTFRSLCVGLLTLSLFFAELYTPLFALAEDEATDLPQEERELPAEEESTEEREEAEQQSVSEDEIPAGEDTVSTAVSEDDRDEAGIPFEVTGEELVPEGATEDVKLEVVYGMGLARDVAVSVNSVLRNESAQSSYMVNKGELETIAKKRAKELALYWDDKHPDGSNRESNIYEVKFYGKNLNDRDKVLSKLKSEYPGIGQPQYKSLAIGHVTVNSYDYWAVELSNGEYADGDDARDNSTITETIKLNKDYISKCTTEAVFDKSVVTKKNGSTTIIQIESDSYTKLPVYNGYLEIKDGKHMPSGKCKIQNAAVSFSVASGDAELKNNNSMIGKKGGSDGKLKASTTLLGIKSGDYSYDFHILVHPESIKLAWVDGNAMSEVPLDQTFSVNAQVFPENADDRAYTIKSSNEKILHLSASANAVYSFTATSSGDAQLIAEPADKHNKGIKDTLEISVVYDEAVEAPKIVNRQASYHAGDTLLLSCATPDAEIYYKALSIEDDTPYNASGELVYPSISEFTRYRDGIRLSQSVSLFLLAKKADMKSEIVFIKDAAELIPADEDWGDLTKEDRQLYKDATEVPEGLWVAGLDKDGYDYTGKDIKPSKLRVYDHTTRLVEKKQYTLSYQNNINAGDKAAVVFSMRGSYSGKHTEYFTIKTASLKDCVAQAASVKYKGKAQTPKLKLKWKNVKSLKAGVDYEISNEESFIDAGSYTLVLTGKGSFEDSIEATFVILAPGKEKKDMSKAKVSAIPSQSFSKDGYKSAADLKDKNNNSLQLSVKMDGVETDAYETEVLFGDTVGKAILRIRPVEGSGFVGVKDVGFKITGTALKKAVTVEGIEPQVYRGGEIIQNPVLKKPDGTTLTEDEDYTVTYRNNEEAGTAKVTFSALASAGYTGVITKSFKIAKYDISSLKVDYPKSIVYQKGGAVYDPKDIHFQNKEGTDIELVYGADYTISYKNNKKAAASDAANAPMLTISGKGNYTGKLTNLYFTIEKSDIASLTGTASDVTYKASAGNYKTGLKVVDVNGKSLTAGTDYRKDMVIYRYNEACTVNNKKLGSVKRLAGEEIDGDDIIPENTTLMVAFYGSGNYQGVLHALYKVAPAGRNLSGIKISVKDQTYTGYAILPKKSDFSFSGTSVSEEEFDIVGYSNNTAVGKASVTIRGTGGNCGGTKTVTFKIVKKQVSE